MGFPGDLGVGCNLVPDGTRATDSPTPSRTERAPEEFPRGRVVPPTSLDSELPVPPDTQTRVRESDRYWGSILGPPTDHTWSPHLEDRILVVIRSPNSSV